MELPPVHLPQQRGIALLLALFYLVLLALVSSTLMQAAALELRMAATGQVGEKQFRFAQGVVSALFDARENLSTALAPGMALCLPGDNDPACAGPLHWPTGFVLPGASMAYARVRRMPPEWEDVVPAEPPGDVVVNLPQLQMARFEIRVAVYEAGAGGVTIHRGVAIMVSPDDAELRYVDLYWHEPDADDA